MGTMDGLHTQLATGQIVAGDYRVEKPLSAGGMGAVYIVTQINTNRRRALKVMHPELAAHPKFRERFRQEAQVGASIHSDHVVEVVDAGVDTGTNMPYLAMELLDGADLADTVAQYGPLGRDQIATLYDQLCHALAAAHHVGVVHRDLKPENLFLARARRADLSFTLKILDFGIAKMVAEARTGRTATQSIGSPMWMAPEQTVAGSTITPQTDIWPLGLIAFFLLTGRPFWRSANTENPQQMMMLREICFEPMPTLAARAHELGVAHLIPPGFDAWFARCVAREPGDRFANVGQAHAALTPILRGPTPRTLQSPVYQPPPTQQPAQPAVQPPPLDGTLQSAGSLPTSAVAPELVAMGAAPTTVGTPHSPRAPTSVGPATVPAGYPPVAATQLGQPVAPPVGMTQPGPTAPGMGHLPASSTAEPVAVHSSTPRSSKAPLFIVAAIVALGGIVGLALALRGGETTTETATISDVKPASKTKPEPSAAESTKQLEPPPPAPSPSLASSETPPTPSTSNSSAFVPGKPQPTGQWPKPQPYQPEPQPYVAPDPEPYVPPEPQPDPGYGRPCSSRGDCPSGYDCSYGGKCVPM
jgi:serine/threonine protein kinase